MQDSLNNEQQFVCGKLVNFEIIVAHSVSR